MAKTSLIISSVTTTDGKKLQKTLTDINSAATNDQLKYFAQVFNNLSTNQYVESNRVDKINCDTEDGIGDKARDIIITGAAQGETATIAITIAEDETVTPAVFFYGGGTAQKLTATAAASEDENVAKFTVTVPASSGTLYVGVAAAEGFAADFAVATVE